MDAEILLYDIPLRADWAGARRRRGCLLRLEQNGILGWGEAAPDPAASPRDVARLAADLQAGLREPRRAPQAPESRHAWVTALLDHEGQKQGKPLWKILRQGPGPDAVPINAVLPRLSTEATVEEATARVREGYTTLKIKIGPAAEELQRVRAVREALAGKIRLRVDPNAAWDLPTARRRLQALKPLEVEYVEQPVQSSEAMERLADSRVPVAPDESMADLPTAKRWIAEETFPYAILKPALLGGLDVTAALIRLAGESGTRLVVTDRLETLVGRAAALHAALLLPSPVPACGLDGARWLAKDLPGPTPFPPGPRIAAPTGPGLGFAPSTGGLTRAP